MSTAVTRDDRLTVAFLGLHPDRVRVVVERCGGTADALASIRRGRVDGVDPLSAVPADAARAAVRAAGCTIVMLGDLDYPPALASIIDPPDVLFVTGSLPRSAGVAVVGTRRCTNYGTRIAAAYGRAIAEAGWSLVSGLARGIDGAAHEGTVEAGGVGVAVLGSGSDVVYPREHGPLRDRLLDLGGAVITEYPPGTPPNGWRFPPRNRIISGLADAVVVVEAATTGGALVTAARAAEQGRAVFAVPGDIDREASAGCNRLIRDGAIPVFDSTDLIEALGLVLGPPEERSAPVPSPAIEDDGPALVGPGGATVDDVGRRLGITGTALLAFLGRLELDGTIRREGELIFPGR
ncbi:MAG TPA: DNA-processing protein DprA [Acidimicrobiia bacterium]|nr:DNA-processing protein DprA [Acidimicrobiia bacterium]